MLKSQPSRTAQSVAASLLAISDHPAYRELVPRETIPPSEWFLKSYPGPIGWLAKFSGGRILYFCIRLIEQITNPGLSVHIAVRKLWIEDQVRQLLRRGFSQVMVLGAGFDTLAYRGHTEYPRVGWWEMDHPATQRLKKSTIENHCSFKNNLQLLAVDFSRQNPAAVLKGSGYSDNVKTIFIAEGLLMYLNQTDVEKLLQTIRDCGRRGSVLIGTALEPGADGGLYLRDGNWLTNLKLKLIGQPYQWGVSPRDLPAFLDQNGWQCLNISRTADILPEYLKRSDKIPRLSQKEYLFTAST